MDLARFCYDFEPAASNAVIDIPQTRGPDDAALQHVLEPPRLETLAKCHDSAIEDDRQQTREWLGSLSELLAVAQPLVRRADGTPAG